MSACQMDDSPWCAPGTCATCDSARRPAGIPGGPVVGHVSLAHGVAHGPRPSEVRRVAERVRRQLKAGEHPSLDEVKILVDALLDG